MSQRIKRNLTKKVMNLKKSYLTLQVLPDILRNYVPNVKCLLLIDNVADTVNQSNKILSITESCLKGNIS